MNYIEGKSSTSTRIGQITGEAMCLNGLNRIARCEGRHADALELGRQILAVYRELGNPWRIAEVLGSMAQSALAQLCRPASERSP